MTDRRCSEESFPVKEAGEASAREKNIGHGHTSARHICSRFINAKRLEWEDYRLDVTPRELNKYLPNF